jgi:multidrug efflux pump subunit AcrB
VRIRDVARVEIGSQSYNSSFQLGNVYARVSDVKLIPGQSARVGAKGLKKGERVVSESTRKVRDGILVELEESGTPRVEAR